MKFALIDEKWAKTVALNSHVEKLLLFWIVIIKITVTFASFQQTVIYLRVFLPAH